MAHTHFRSALQGTNEIEITVTGRSSGRSLTYPVWFVLEGDTLSLLPVKGSETDWYKNLRKTPTIQVSARGKTFKTLARLLTDEAQVGEVAQKFRGKYGAGQVKAYYPKLDGPSKSHSREVQLGSGISFRARWRGDEERVRRLASDASSESTSR